MHSTSKSRRALAQAIFLGLVGNAPAWASPVVLPTTTSLAASLEQAMQAKQPLVVMVSLVGCAFCKVVRENYLHPLRASGLHIVQLDMRDHGALADWDGTVTTPDAWIRRQGVKIAPTVLFFGPKGRELATRLTGAYLPDFYGAYLDEQLAIARKKMQGT